MTRVGRVNVTGPKAAQLLGRSEGRQIQVEQTPVRLTSCAPDALSLGGLA